MGINTTSQIFPTRDMIEGLSPATVDIGRADDLTQSIVNAAGINTYTLAHNATYSIMNIYDTDLSTYLLWAHAGTVGAKTTTLILDLGKRTFVHNTLINFTLIATRSDATEGQSFTTSWSNDATTWTQIDTTVKANGVYNTQHDHSLEKTRYRYLKIVYYSLEVGADSELQCYVNRVGLFR